MKRTTYLHVPSGFNSSWKMEITVSKIRHLYTPSFAAKRVVLMELACSFHAALLQTLFTSHSCNITNCAIQSVSGIRHRVGVREGWFHSDVAVNPSILWIDSVLVRSILCRGTRKKNRMAGFMKVYSVTSAYTKWLMAFLSFTLHNTSFYVVSMAEKTLLGFDRNF